MDSIYNHSKFGESLNCTGAINGNKDTTWRSTRDPNPNCVYNKQFAPGERYWQVDLGQTHNIHRITIYPERYSYHMRGITVFVDNTQVYQYPTSGDIPLTPRVITPDPPLRGRVIKLTNGGKYVTLCELELDGCVSNRYGAGCQETCSAGCQPDTCDSITGDCTCNIGWTGSQCRACISGRYGTDCQLTCGAGCQNTACNQNTGRCSPCRTGWTGNKCDGCVAGRYGQDCRETCPPGCDGPCDVITGNCSCRSQWRQPGCTECSAGHYSPNLGCKACGAGCEDVTSCDPLTGLCSCQRGWEPPTCHVCKTRLWGDNCTMACGACAGDGSCDRITGACYFGLSSDDGGSNTGAIVGAVVGVGIVICITILVTGLLIRSRRLPQPTLEHSETPQNSAAEGHEAATECRADFEATNGEGIGEQGDVSHNYDTPRSYENADDIRFYTSLETNQPSTHGPQDANTTTATANYENLYVTTDNQ